MTVACLRSVRLRFKKTGKRNGVFLATKFGFAHGIKDKFVHAPPEYVPKALEKSLARLGVESIDLWYLHRLVDVLVRPKGMLLTWVHS